MTNYKNHEIAEICPECGIPLHMSTMVSEGENSAPSEGDVSVCFNCACVLVFREDLRQEKMPEDEIEALATEDRKTIAKLVRAVKQMPEFGQRHKKVVRH